MFQTSPLRYTEESTSGCSEMPSTDKDLDCVICGRWPEHDRELMRRFCCIAIPLREEVCDKCIEAFFVYMTKERGWDFPAPHHRRKPRRHRGKEQLLANRNWVKGSEMLFASLFPQVATL